MKIPNPRPAFATETGCRTPDNGWAPRSVGPRSAAATALRPPPSGLRAPTPDLRLPSAPYPPSSISHIRTNFNLNLNLNKPAPLSPNCYLPSSVRLNAPAFSLTEVVIALGIFAVSMVGILALFPVASSAGRESSEETQAAILAQTIIDDLVDAANQRSFTNSLIIRGPNTVNTSGWVTLRLNSNSVNFIGYDIAVRSGNPLQGVGMQGDPIALKASSSIVTSNSYSNGVAALAYLARIEVSTNTGIPNLSQVTVRIEAPGSLPATNRRVYQFGTLVTGR